MNLYKLTYFFVSLLLALTCQAEGSDYLTITVIGKRSDLVAQKLHVAALAYSAEQKKVEWWDKADPDLPERIKEYPTLSRAAAFACIKDRCSLPIFSPEKLEESINQLMKSPL